MELKTLTYIVVGITFSIYIGIALWMRAGSTKEFYVANKEVNPVLNGMATAADWMSAASFISMAGMIAFLGYNASAYLMGWTGGYVILALLLAPYLRKFGKFTVSEFIGDRYYSNTARLVAVVCLIVASITYVIGQMKGVGVAFSRFMEINYELGLALGICIVLLYAVLGGMKGITYTQIAQYCILIFAYTVPAIFISLHLTGNPIPQVGLFSSLKGEEGYLLDKLSQISRDLGFGTYTEMKGSKLNIILLTLSLMIGTAGLPHVIMRFFTVPKVKDARNSVGWSLLFIALLYTTAPAVGAMAFFNFTKTVQTGEIGVQNANLVYEDRPVWVKNWETTGLLKYEDKNGDGQIQYYNEADPEMAKRAASYGWQGNEMEVDQDIMVLANPEIANLPNWVIALVAAGGLAAALSTAAGLLMAISSAVSHDLLKGIIAPNISEKNELIAARASMAIATLIAGWLGLNPPGFAAQVVALAFGIAAASIFPVLIMGVFFKNINKEGAIAGMLVGLISTVLYIFIYKGFFFIPGANLFPDTPEYWLFGINPTGFGFIGCMLNVATAMLVSSVTPATPDNVRQLVDRIRQP